MLEAPLKLDPEIEAKLGWYVYRLIDPTNCETFYIGKGKGSRVLQHANNKLKPRKKLGDDNEEDKLDLKQRRIKKILDQDLSVIHVIHRHNILTEELAYEIEAALIDAYPGLTNTQNGHGSDDFGCRHLQQIINEYKAEEFKAAEDLILISVNRSSEIEDRELLDAVRGVWKIKLENALRFKLVLAHRRGMALGAFRPEQWVPATPEYFNWLPEAIEGRIGFVGHCAEKETTALYVKRRVPDKYRPKGAANPIRYVEAEA